MYVWMNCVMFMGILSFFNKYNRGYDECFMSLCFDYYFAVYKEYNIYNAL